MNPFPGIRSFESTEDNLFFGREKQVEELILSLSETHFLAIIGSSGCGKSSLIRAGLVPSLFKGKIQKNEREWNLSIFRPGDNPIRSMAVSLFEASSTECGFSSVDEVEGLLRSGRNGVIDVCETLFDKTNQNQLIIIDQFEELFRFKHDEELSHAGSEAKTFVNLFIAAAQQRDIPIYIVLTMRSDFIDYCPEFRGLPEAINKGHYLVPRMTTNEIKSAIEKPAELFGAEISDRLVRRLLNDVSNAPDQLPVLQHALMRTWNHWEQSDDHGKSIDIHHYEEIGTMKEALSLHAEEIYNELPEQKTKGIAEKLFKALTDISSDGKGIRRPTQLGDICALVEAKQEVVVNIIDHFRATGCAFLMPSINVELDSNSVIDISHESIMRIWNRLRNWVDEETKSAQLYLRISKVAELYQEGKAGLLVNPELQLGLNWLNQNKPNATWALRYDPAFDRAITYLQFSKKEYEREIANKEAQQKRSLKRARRIAVFMGTVTLISLMFLVISLNLRYQAQASEKKALEKETIAVQESRNAERQRREALSQKKIAEQQQQIAEQQKIITEEQKQYAVQQQQIAEEQEKEAIRQKQSADVARNIAVEAKDEAEVQRKEAVSQRQIAESEKSRAERLRLIAIARSMAVQASQIQNTQRVQTDLPKLLALQAYYLNRDNKGLENDPAIFNAISAVSEDEIILRGHQDGIRAIAISNDKHLMVSCSDDGTVRLWNLSGGNTTSRNLNTAAYGKNGFRSLALKSDGSLLAAGSTEGQILIWDMSKAEDAPMVLVGHSSSVSSICFSEDSKTLVSTGSDGTIKLWNLTSENTETLSVQLPSAVHAIAFSSDGKKLASGCHDGSIKLFNSDNLSEVSYIQQPNGKPVYSLAFSNDGKILASGNSAGIVKLWNMNNLEAKPAELIGHTSRVSNIRFSTDDIFLATCSYDKTVRLWNYKVSGEQPIILRNHDSWVYDIEFTPDVNKIASASADKTIYIQLIQSEKMIDAICSSITRNLFPEEWNKYVGSDIDYRKTCPQLP